MAELKREHFIPDLDWSDPLERRCPRCKVVIYGRASKKYCSVECRNAVRQKRYRENKKRKDFI